MWFLFFLGFWFHGFIYDLEGIGVPCWKKNIPAWTVSRRNDSIQACQHNKLQISVICEKLCKLRKLNGDLAFKKAALNTWIRTWAVMAGDAWCNVYALSFTCLKTIFVQDLTETGLWQLCTTVGTPFQIFCSGLTVLIGQWATFVLSVPSLPFKP